MEEVEDVRGVLKVYRDGSIFRLDVPDLFVPPSEELEDGGVASKDVVFNADLGLWVRLYLRPPPTTGTRMPIIVYFHGGGFCLASPAVPDFHNFCVELAAAVGAIIISVNYRLAPEHRLPVAYSDCLEAVEWLRSQSQSEGVGFERETWLQSYADFSQVYLLGHSAGANIAHQVLMLSRGNGGKDWRAAQIRGVILLQPFFGGEQRTSSETECPCDAFLTLDLYDTYWRLSLPLASNRDHPFCNPLGPDSPSLKDADLPPLLVAVGGRDMLRDRNFHYCSALTDCEKQVEVIVFQEEDHGFYARRLHSQSSRDLLQHISRFVARFS